jgi:hypothetical protein
MLPLFHIVKSWNVDDFYNLDYTLAAHKDLELINQYESSGHIRSSMTLYNCHEPNHMPHEVFSYIKPKFNFLQNIGMAINWFKPGQYLPLHVDLFGRFSQVTGARIENIVRYMVMLEDAVPGQILQIGDQCYGAWSAGDCFGWKYDQRHAFYNFSMHNRYAVQVTGVVNEN